MITNKPDRLSALIQRFRVEAKVTPNDFFCNPARQDHAAAPNLFIFRRIQRDFSEQALADLPEQSPSLVFFPRGAPSDFKVPGKTDDSDFVCASVDTGGEFNPISLALPATVTVPLDMLNPLRAVTDLLLEEAQSPRCGGRAVIDRLCEIVVIRLLRHLIEQGKAEVGLVAGLAHPNLSLAIVAIHENPEKHWTLESLAETAAMSRTQFANGFRETVGVTPGEYLSGWRLTLAHMEMMKGAALKTVVEKVGFSSSAALSRAFKRQYGISPRQVSPHSR